MRLPPIVSSKSSPWYGYLQHVYGSSMRMPVKLKDFELFYTEYLPTMPCLVQQETVVGSDRLCSPSLCSGWLADRKPSAVEAYAYISNRSIGRRDNGRHAVVIVQRPIAERTFAVPNSWVEVTRSSMGRSLRPGVPKEGLGFGCWYYAARGSGVWLSVGARTVGFRTRPDAYAGLGKTKCDHRANSTGQMIRYLTGGSCTFDFLWAEAVRRERRSATLQVLDTTYRILGPTMGGASSFAFTAALDTSDKANPQDGPGAFEVVDAQGLCVDADEPLLDGCPPIDSSLRGGWHAERPCNCHDISVTARCHPDQAESEGAAHKESSKHVHGIWPHLPSLPKLRFVQAELNVGEYPRESTLA